MVVTDAMDGAPGRLHGGIMMAFFDEGMGLVTMHLGVETMTASLTVDLRAPVLRRRHAAPARLARAPRGSQVVPAR